MFGKQEEITAFDSECEDLIAQGLHLREKQSASHADMAQAVTLFRQASEQGYPLGWYWLGYAYSQEERFTRGLCNLGLNRANEAAVLFAKVKDEAGKGNAIAQYALGLMHEKGHGVSRCIPDAKKEYEHSARQGYALAQNALARLCEPAGQAGDYDESVNWYTQSARQGNRQAQYQLGYLSEKQSGTHSGVTKSNVKATLWYRAAILQGSERAYKRLERLAKEHHCKEAECVLGELLMIGNPMTGEPDFMQAHTFLKQATDKGHRRARCYLGFLYEYGCIDGQAPSMQAASFFHAYHTKLDTRFPLQQLISGVNYLRHIKQCGYAQNPDKANEFFGLAKKVSMQYQGYDYKPMLAFIERHAQSGKVGANVLLVIIYSGGFLGVRPDPNKVAVCLNRIRASEDVWLQCSFGYMYRMGIIFDKNIEKAKDWYTLAANKELRPAQQGLRNLYREEENDAVKAKEWDERADNNEVQRPTDSPWYMDASLPVDIVCRRLSSARTALAPLPKMLGIAIVEATEQVDAQNPSHLGVNKGEQLYVIRQRRRHTWESGWWHCQNQARQEGLVQREHLRVLHDAEAESVFDASELPHQTLAIDTKALQPPVKVLGKGGFGEVRRYQWSGIWVAVKVSLNQAHDSAAERDEFNRELALMAKLNHPNIVRLCAYTRVKNNEVPMLVMEYMDRGTLYSEFAGRDESRATEAELAYSIRYQIALNIAMGLRYLHHHHYSLTQQRSIVHRDLKSVNILFCHYQGNPYFAKIADFGLSVLQENEQGYSFKSVLGNKPEGTISILAPELLGGTESGIWRYTPKTDIYSFALILWEMMKYELPYKALNAGELATFVLAGKREQIPKDAPKAFQEATRQGWAQEPDDRPSIEALIDLLRAGQAEEGVVDVEQIEDGLRIESDGMGAETSLSTWLLNDEPCLSASPHTTFSNASSSSSPSGSNSDVAKSALSKLCREVEDAIKTSCIGDERKQTHLGMLRTGYQEQLNSNLTAEEAIELCQRLEKWCEEVREEIHQAGLSRAEGKEREGAPSPQAL